MDPKKMMVAVLVTVAAAAAAIAATAHSRRVLEEEQVVYPPGTLALGASAEMQGVEVRVEGADVVEAVSSLETRGYDKLAAGPDRRFVRLTMSVENGQGEKVDVKALCGTLRFVEISTNKPMDTEIVWLRGYDALSPEELAPGERSSGKLAVEVSEFPLAFPFLVEIGDATARWGVDVIDRGAAIDEFM